MQPADAVPLYDSLAPDYDRFVNWESRLAHELPFLECLFREHGVRSVLDAACGTGGHAIALAQRGYQAIGADLSGAMVEQARQNALKQGAGVSFVVAGLGRLASLGQSFDAVLCLGNSLPHLLTVSAVAEALADFASMLRPGGLLVIQNRNFDSVLAAHERFMDPQWHRSPAGEWIFIRFYDFHEETITFHVVRLRRTEKGWAQDVESTELRPILGNDLASGLGRAGFGAVKLYGGYDSSPFDPMHSSDLLAVASV